jgi:DNA-binding response OmpR family regulator
MSAAGAAVERGRIVFLGEDDDTLRDLIARTLRADGYEIVEARDGLELLAHIERALLVDRERPSRLLVVTDVEMPGLTGLDVVAILRCAKLPTPCVVITASGNPETHVEAYDMGVHRVFDKPVALDELRATLRELTAR